MFVTLQFKYEVSISLPINARPPIGDGATSLFKTGLKWLPLSSNTIRLFLLACLGFSVGHGCSASLYAFGSRT